MKRCIALADEHACQALAQTIAQHLNNQALLTFSGVIGAGKTTFIRALLRALGVRGPIKSPTFSLVESYQCSALTMHHFDLYRIHDEMELEYIGFRDYFVNQAICCIEWPERAPHSIINVDLRFLLTDTGNGRLMTIDALSMFGEKVLSSLAGKT